MAEAAVKDTAPPAHHPAPARLVGHVDQIEGGFVRGWARDEAAAGRRVVVDVHLGDRLLGSATADRFREDLAAAGVGDGRHAFVFTLPPAARTVAARAITVCFQGTREALVRTEGGSAVAAAPPPEPDRSTHRLDAIERAVGNLRSGLDGLDTELRGARARLEQVGRDHGQVLAAIGGLERHLGGNRIGGLGERIAALDAAIAVLRDDSTQFRARFEAIDKALSDVDAFLYRFDERLRTLGGGPRKRTGHGLAVTVAILALLLALAALAAALRPELAALVG